MFSSNDIIICEGKTDDIYISKALQHFRADYPTLQFDFLRVGGTDADNIKHLVDKFQVDTDKKIIILVDRDGAGEGVYKSLFPDSTTQKKDIDFKKYPDNVQDNVQDNVFFLMIPPSDTNQTGSNFQIENYFGNSVIRDTAKSYVDESYTDNSGFSDLSNKLQDKVKYKLLEHLTDSSKMEGFKTLLDKLAEIMST